MYDQIDPNRKPPTDPIHDRTSYEVPPHRHELDRCPACYTNGFNDAMSAAILRTNEAFEDRIKAMTLAADHTSEARDIVLDHLEDFFHCDADIIING